MPLVTYENPVHHFSDWPALEFYRSDARNVWFVNVATCHAIHHWQREDVVYPVQRTGFEKVS